MVCLITTSPRSVCESIICVSTIRISAWSCCLRFRRIASSRIRATLVESRPSTRMTRDAEGGASISCPIDFAIMQGGGPEVVCCCSLGISWDFVRSTAGGLEVFAFHVSLKAVVLELGRGALGLLRRLRRKTGVRGGLVGRSAFDACTPAIKCCSKAVMLDIRGRPILIRNLLSLVAGE